MAVLHFPSYEQGLDSVDYRYPDKIIYNFRTEEATHLFAKLVKTWSEQNLLPSLTIKAFRTKPFANPFPPFAAKPDKFSYQVELKLPARMNSHQITEIIRYLGLRQSVRS